MVEMTLLSVKVVKHDLKGYRLENRRIKKNTFMSANSTNDHHSLVIEIPKFTTWKQQRKEGND